jgi:NAD+ kinase
MTENRTFNRVAIIGRQRQESTQETFVALYEYLKTRGYKVVFERETAPQLSLKPGERIPPHQLAEACDILLIVGGDGSLLHAAQIAVDQSLPVAGINRGRLGFLTDIYPHQFAKIEQLLNGHYHEEQRFLLTAHIQRQSQVAAAIPALNEIVLSAGNIAHMVEFNISVNGQPVCEMRADGLIIATPTGSTAYALSGGGPILHPSLNAVVLVPMFPHTLSNRPIVLDADSRITIHIPENSEATPYISGDGQNRVAISPGETLAIEKKSQMLRLIHPLDYNYFETLRSKLGWQGSAIPLSK